MLEKQSRPDGPKPRKGKPPSGFQRLSWLSNTVTDYTGLDLSLYGGLDPREIPTYNIAEVARYLCIPRKTLSQWTQGRTYKTRWQTKFAKPVIILAENDLEYPMLSFMNLLEAHMLDSITRRHNIQLQDVRWAMEQLGSIFPASRHPLIEKEFETDGKNLLLEHLGKLINLNRGGQYEMRVLIDEYLQRIQRDKLGTAVRLYPFIVKPKTEPPQQIHAQSKGIMIDPLISFGRPVIAGTGIPTSIIAERRWAGESLASLAKDYGRTEEEIKEAVEYEDQRIRKAA